MIFYLSLKQCAFVIHTFKNSIEIRNAKECIIFLFLILLSFTSYSQEKQIDTLQYLPEVLVQVYPQQVKYKESSGSLSIITPSELNRLQNYSLVSVVNTKAGVRMEERSPGSYRLSIRGSVLRSPYGVRNLKVYFENIPFTDASGNTYFNSLDPSCISSIEFIKGPDGSIFGANTGGIVQVNGWTGKVTDKWNAGGSISTGSFGLFKENITVAKAVKKWSFSVGTGYQSSQGYRENSALKRYYFQPIIQWRPWKKYAIKWASFYSDLSYRTPGALTLDQYLQNPQQARPATRTLPGAAEQNAAVMNKQLLTGVVQDFSISESLRYTLILFANGSQFQNPYITNYEVRNERSLGVRSYITYNSSFKSLFHVSATLGGEHQNTHSSISNYGNRKGVKDTIQASDNIRAIQSFIFMNVKISYNNKIFVEGGASINQVRYHYKNLFPAVSNELDKNFQTVIMPKVGASYAVTKNLYLRASISKGFSPPSLAEFRPSTTSFYPGLNAETGINYETGIRYLSKNGIIRSDLIFFRYNLSNAIVSRRDEAGNDFFINSGGTKQKGVEWESTIQLISASNNFKINEWLIGKSITWYHFRFMNYETGGVNYSSNRITGVPELTLSFQTFLKFLKNYSLSLNYLFNSPTPLNDGNTVYAAMFHLLQAKASIRFIEKKFLKLNVFLGGDNLLNQHYSLGNDLNAAGGRYYNSAAALNFYGGLSFIL